MILWHFIDTMLSEKSSSSKDLLKSSSIEKNDRQKNEKKKLRDHLLARQSNHSVQHENRLESSIPSSDLDACLLDMNYD